LEIEAYAATDVGTQRTHNEDAFDVVSEHGFHVVADGMGGHASGAVASRMAIENLRKYITQLAARPDHEFTFPVHVGAGPPEVLVSNAIQWANERIFIESFKNRNYEGMGTTIVCTLAYHDLLVVGHVGDSRIYRFRGGQLEQMTKDHSLLNHYIDEGRITTDEERRNFKETNIIVKALGLKDYVEPDIRVVDRRHGDVFLLCTDGLTDQVDDWILTNVLLGNSDDLAGACDTLIKLANEAGGKDNCTVMMLKVVDPEAPPPPEPGFEEEIDWAEETQSGVVEVPVLPPISPPAPSDESSDSDRYDYTNVVTEPEIPVYSGDEPTDPGKSKK